MRNDNKREINTVYWYRLFVPVVISILIFVAFFVFIFAYTGTPHSLVNKLHLPPPNTSAGEFE